MNEETYARNEQMYVDRLCGALLANMIDDPYKRARRLYNLGVRGVWDRKSVENLIINGHP